MNTNFPFSYRAMKNEPGSSATVDGPRDTIYQSKSCQLLHNCIKNKLYNKSAVNRSNGVKTLGRSKLVCAWAAKDKYRHDHRQSHTQMNPAGTGHRQPIDRRAYNNDWVNEISTAAVPAHVVGNKGQQYSADQYAERNADRHDYQYPCRTCSHTRRHHHSATKVCRYNWHSAGFLGWPFPALNIYIFLK